MKDNFKIDFLGIGAAKSASTWMSSLLSQHPEIEFPMLKEATFFNKYDFNGELNKKYKYGLDYYHRLWSQKGKNKYGEWSPQYLFDKSAASSIYKYSSNIKLLVILRNPVHRAYSHFLYDQHFNKKIKQKFSFTAACNEYNYLLKAGLYCEQLDRYYSLFPKKNIKILVFENVIKNPLKTSKELYEFLGVDASFIPNFLAKNENKKIKYESINYLISLPGKFKRQVSHFSNITDKGIAAFEKSKLYQHLFYWKVKLKDQNVQKITTKTIDKQDYNMCFEIFKKDINNLKSQYNVDVSRWKT